MQVVILCGGKGLRMGNSSEGLPKPLCEVNGRPILWQIMQWYRRYGYHDFFLLLGHQGHKIKEYFLQYPWRYGDVSVNLRNHQQKLLTGPEDWRITFVDTGIDAMTGARLKQVEHLITEEHFMLTYGDGLANVNVTALMNFHQSKNTVMTVTGVKRQSPFGAFRVDQGIATRFVEKPTLQGWTNGGFFVCHRSLFQYLSSDLDCALEDKPMQSLAHDGQLAVYPHHGFWIGIDTQKELQEANQKWPQILIESDRRAP